MGVKGIDRCPISNTGSSDVQQNHFNQPQATNNNEKKERRQAINYFQFQLKDSPL